MLRFLFTMLFSLASTNAMAASFDCTKAASAVEKIICGDKNISELDNFLAEVYKTEVDQEARSSEIKNSQRNWLNQRNLCNSADCITRQYETRLAELICDPKSIGSGSGTSSAQCHFYSLKIVERELVPIEQQYAKKMSTDSNNSDYLLKSFLAESKAWRDYRTAQCRLYGAQEGGIDSWKNAFALGCEYQETKKRVERLAKEIKN